jgi:dTDP-L-rhamnose 4-epimerase
MVGSMPLAATVILPVLDEAEALPWVLGRVPPGFGPLVVDNGSTDGSGALARELGARVVDEPQRGFGAACWAGLVAAPDGLVCFMDADGSLDPADLAMVVAPVADGRADLVLAARRPEPGAWPWPARAANGVLAARTSRRLGFRLHDIGPMRAARRDALLALGLRDRRSGWPLEMVVRAARAGWRVDEVAVRYRRRVGRSKVTGTVRGTVQAVADMGRVLRQADCHGEIA